MYQTEILEAQVGALNLGEAMEAIFSIIAANFLATGKATLADVQRIRKKIISGKELVLFDSNLGNNHVSVTLLIRLKTEPLKTVFGPTSDPDMPETLDRRTKLLISSFEQTSAYQRISALRNEFVKEKGADIISFSVIADGASGEISKGSIKGDIIVKIVAKNKGGKTVTLPFSIKSESITVANLSPAAGMLKFANVFGLSKKFVGDLQEFKDHYKDFQGEDKKKIIENLFARMIAEVKKLSFTPELTKKVFDLLEKEVFGDDLADVIDITNTAIKEISLTNFNKLRKNTEIIAISSVRSGPPVLQFFRKPEEGEITLNDMIFQLRTKIRETSRGGYEFKMYVEVGKLLYLQKKAELEDKLDTAEEQDNVKKVSQIKKQLKISPTVIYQKKEKETKKLQNKALIRNAKRLKSTTKFGDRRKKD